MAAAARSLSVTDAYRARLLALRSRAGHLAAADWRTLVDINDLDGTHPLWVARTATALTVIQSATVRLTGAYLTAFLRSELGRPVTGPAIDPGAYVGSSRTGKPLDVAIAGTVITVKKAIAAGHPPNDAFDVGRAQAERLAITETMDTARAALSDTIHSDPRIVGWHRVTAGGCGACLAAATRTYRDHEPLRVHDNCRCGAEPIVADVPDRFPRPTGHDIFDGMTVAQQNAALGAPTAQLVRSGKVPLHDLIAVSPMEAIPDQITQAPLKALQDQAS